MKIEPKLFNIFVGMMAERQPDDEVEIVYSPKTPMTRNIMLSTISYFASKARAETQTDQIDVTFANSTVRFSIDLGKTISWSDTDMVDLGKVESSGLEKTRIQSALEFTEYDMRINMKREKEVSVDVAAYAGRAAHYRLKRRFSYMMTDNVRLDLTAVRTLKTARGSGHPMYGSLLAAPETYEMELEWIGGGAENSRPVATEQAKEIMTQFNVALKVVRGSYYGNVLSRSEIAQVITEYSSAFGQESRFAAPNPITMELYHLRCVDVQTGVPCVFNNYIVMDKTDGERRLLIITKDGKAFTIDQNMNVLDAGLRVKSQSVTVLDGEYVARTGTFHVFDIYFMDGRDVRDIPLTDVSTKGSDAETRMKLVDIILKRIGNVAQDRAIEIKTKEYRVITSKSSFVTACTYMLKRHDAHMEDKQKAAKGKDTDKKASDAKSGKKTTKGLPYDVDGLIFTPILLPVPRNGGAWPAVLKWKPSDMNTIDFKVVLRRPTEYVRDAGKAGAVSVVADLMVGQNALHAHNINVIEYMSGQSAARLSSAKTKGYGSVSFDPPSTLMRAFPNIAQGLSVVHLPLDADKLPTCDSGEIIIDNAVTEFAFDASPKVPDEQARWKPLRMRWDKTNGNNIQNALSVWRSIVNPIDRATLTDVAKLDARVEEFQNALKSDDYYMSIPQSIIVSTPESRARSELRKFHNHIKRSVLLEPFGAIQGGGRTVFDFGCGRGGDLQKWVDMGAQRVVGIDKYASNLYDPVDGAYARMFSMKVRRPTVVFLPLDAGCDIMSREYLLSIPEPEREAVQILWGLVPVESIQVASMRKFHGFVRPGGFDLASMMFMVHYFFDEEAHISQLVANAAKLVRKGGHLVGSSLDGAKVRELLAKQEVVDGFTAEGELSWRIKRRFDARSPGFGHRIDVYMNSIGQEIPEYLVDYELLLQVMKRHGFEEVKSATFDVVYKEMSATMPELHMMTAIERKYSFLNRYFIFKRA